MCRLYLWPMDCFCTFNMWHIQSKCMFNATSDFKNMIEFRSKPVCLLLFPYSHNIFVKATSHTVASGGTNDGSSFESFLQHRWAFSHCGPRSKLPFQNCAMHRKVVSGMEFSSRVPEQPRVMVPWHWHFMTLSHFPTVFGDSTCSMSCACQGVANPWTLSRCECWVLTNWMEPKQTRPSTVWTILILLWNCIFFLQSKVVSWLGLGCRPQIEMSASSRAFYWRCRRTTVLIMSFNFRRKICLAICVSASLVSWFILFHILYPFSYKKIWRNSSCGCWTTGNGRKNEDSSDTNLKQMKRTQWWNGCRLKRNHEYIGRGWWFKSIWHLTYLTVGYVSSTQEIDTDC